MTHPGLTSEIQKLAPSAIIELFVLDATALGGDILRFHAGTNELKQNIVFQGNTYVRYPVAVTGFEFAGQGQFPRPKLQVANIFSAITQVLLESNDLMGAKLTRKRTMAKFLDAVNFDGGVNPDEDDTAEFQEDIYYIDRKSGEDRDTVEFELASSLDLVGVSVPRRQIIQNVCIWKYRSSECSYAGPPIVDIDDSQIPLTSAVSAQAIAMIQALEAWQAAATALALAETALTAAAVAQGVACAYQQTANAFDTTNNNVFLDASNVFSSATFGGSPVSLGLTYRQGVFMEDAYVDGTRVGAYYRIEKWEINSGSCSSATSAYNAALADRDTKQGTVTTTYAAYLAAFAALPADDAIYAFDRCGKRLASCEARFGSSSELPFGSFPAAELSR